MAGDLPDWTSQHASGAVLLGTLSLVPGGSKSASLLLDPVPAGVTGLSVIIVGTMALGAVVTSVTAIGQVTGQNYIIGAGIEALTLQDSAEYGGSIPAEAESINVAVDTQNGAATAGVLALVVGWLGNTLVHPQNDPNQPLYIAGPHTPGGGTAPDLMAQGSLAAAFDAGVGGFPAANIDQLVAGYLALTQVPASAPRADMVTTPAAPTLNYTSGTPISWPSNGTTVIAAVAGKSIRLRLVRWRPSAASTGFFLNNPGGIGLWHYMDGPASVPDVMDYQGLALAVGTELQLWNGGAGAESGALDIEYDLY